MQLSIVIPVYNVEKYIHTCLSSIYSQNYDEKKFEVIVVNDGTPDNSIEKINDIVSSHSNIKIINQSNQGLSIARNTGLSECKGDYVWFVDSDDEVTSNSLSIIEEELLKVTPDILATLLLRVNNDETTKDSYSDYLLPESNDEGKHYLFNEGKLGPVQQYVFKREFLLKYKLEFFPNVFHEDGDFCLRSFYLAQSIYLSNSSIYLYYIRAGSIMQSIGLKNLTDLCLIYEHVKEFGNENVAFKDKRQWDALIASLMMAQLSWANRVDNKQEYKNHIRNNLAIFRKAAFDRIWSKHFHIGFVKQYLQLLFTPTHFTNF